MKKIGIIVFVAAIAIGVLVSSFFSFGKAAGSVFNVSFLSGVKGSGVQASETRDVSEFTGVDVSSIFDVEITAQKDFSVDVTADDNLLQYIKTEVSGGVLKIEADERINSHDPIKIRISAPDIESIEASGASKVSLSDVKNSELKVDSSGASKIRISGETTNLNVEVSGASKIDAENLKSENADVDASGASHVNVNVTGELRSDASGASHISYAGNPKKVEKSSSGASRVSPK
jgi:hypothetical protein